MSQKKRRFLSFYSAVKVFFFRLTGRLYSKEWKNENSPIPQKFYAAMSVTYLGAMLASNHALQFVPYPTQVLGKSVKPIPVMILGVLLAGKRYPLRKYLFIILIVAGVAMFLYKEKKGATANVGFGFGELLLVSYCKKLHSIPRISSL